MSDKRLNNTIFLMYLQQKIISVRTHCQTRIFLSWTKSLQFSIIFLNVRISLTA